MPNKKEFGISELFFILGTLNFTLQTIPHHVIQFAIAKDEYLTIDHHLSCHRLRCMGIISPNILNTSTYLVIFEPQAQSI